jgi:hypothetical protein
MTYHRYITCQDKDGSWFIRDTLTDVTPKPAGIALRRLSEDMANQMARLLNTTGVLDDAAKASKEEK